MKTVVYNLLDRQTDRQTDGVIPSFSCVNLKYKILSALKQGSFVPSAL